jgi:hypothetical protein
MARRRTSDWTTHAGGVAIMLLIAARPAGAACRVAAPHTSLWDVLVTTAHGVFFLELDDLTAEIVVTPGPDPMARIEVASPLRFTGSYPRDKLRLRLKRPIEWANGRVRLGTHAFAHWSPASGDAVEVSVHDTLGMDIRPPPRVPCESLELAVEREGLREGTASFIEPRTGRPLGFVPMRVPVFAKASGGDPIESAFRAR